LRGERGKTSRWGKYDDVLSHGGTTVVHGNQGLRDIQRTAVAFLTTRVKNPEEDDWGKLKRLLKYLTGTT
jgi:hypothetical protein